MICAFCTSHLGKTLDFQVQVDGLDVTGMFIRGRKCKKCKRITIVKSKLLREGCLTEN